MLEKPDKADKAEHDKAIATANRKAQENHVVDLIHKEAEEAKAKAEEAKSIRSD